MTPESGAASTAPGPATPASGSATPASADVVVYGATSAGVCAAVAAAEAGASVVLAEPGTHVGGMTSGGLGYTDVGELRVLGGMAARFRRDVAAHYGVAVGTYAGPEPHVAETIFVRWLDEAGVELMTGAPLREVRHRDGWIREIVLGNGHTLDAAVFIDASYEGDLMAGAGVHYAVGREDRALYGEAFAGRREIAPGMHNFPDWVSPFRDDPRGYVESALLPQIRTAALAPVGTGDGGVMSYGFRVCLSTAADRIPFERRAGYDEQHWELGRRLFGHWARQGLEPPAGKLIGLEQNLPGGKADGNSLGPFSLSVLDGSAWRYPDAAASERAAIRQHHLDHTVDFLAFLSHDPSVPRQVRAEMARWGLPSDEFADTGHLPHQLYVREARRMLGEVVLTEHDLRRGTDHPDSIAMGSYHIDIREVQRTWRWAYEHPRPIAMVATEGYLSVPVPPYQIPFAAMLPRPVECRNLLVPVCLSASHVALSSIRMEPQYQMLGHAAGDAAALAVSSHRGVHDLDVAQLQQRLTEAGQVLAL